MQTKDARIPPLLDRIRDSTAEILGHGLAGIWVHGSLALGSFSWDVSDVDFLVAVRQAPSDREKAELIRAYLAIDEDAPPKGLEMSAVTEDACRHFRHPMPYELHFSHGHLERARSDPEGFAASMHGRDRDLAAHVAVTRARGITLFGPDPAAFFAPVPDADYTDAILFDLQDAEEGIAGDPVYLTLNLCRGLAWTQEGKILSKAEGGAWALRKLPGGLHRPVTAALDAYLGNATAADLPDAEELRAFARAVKERILEKA